MKHLFRGMLLHLLQSPSFVLFGKLNQTGIRLRSLAAAIFKNFNNSSLTISKVQHRITLLSLTIFPILTFCNIMEH